MAGPVQKNQWFSRKAPCSHRGGRKFDPCTAHHQKTAENLDFVASTIGQGQAIRPAVEAYWKHESGGQNLVLPGTVWPGGDTNPCSDSSEISDISGGLCPAIGSANGHCLPTWQASEGGERAEPGRRLRTRPALRRRGVARGAAIYTQEVRRPRPRRQLTQGRREAVSPR